MPCCTDRLSLMAGTYGNGCPSLVPNGTAWSAKQALGGLLIVSSRRLVARCEGLSLGDVLVSRILGFFDILARRSVEGKLHDFAKS